MPNKTILSCLALLIIGSVMIVPRIMYPKPQPHPSALEDSIQRVLDDTTLLNHSQIPYTPDGNDMGQIGTGTVGLLTPGPIDTGMTMGQGGWATSDAQGKIMDSTWEDQWFICNYKPVPAQGLFVDTTDFHGKGSQYINIRIIVDRKQIAGFGFCRPAEDSNWFWFTAIDKKGLTPVKPSISVSPSSVGINLDNSNGNIISIK